MMAVERERAGERTRGWRGVINSQPTGNMAAKFGKGWGLGGGKFIHKPPVVKTSHGTNEMTGALGFGCISEYA